MAKPLVRFLAPALALAMSVPALPPPTMADERGYRRDHPRYSHYERRRERDRYIRGYYQRHGRDRDYRRWERNRHRWNDRDYRRWYESRRHHDNDSGRQALIAGLFGLAAGAIIGGALSQSGQAAAPQPAYPTYGAGPYQGSAEWLQYCSARYRSFNPQTGMYRGYDGRLHPCR